ncbi:MAG: hydroxymethylglutaryl-CoA reductase [Patescibacteria group bacterium]
MKLSEYSSSAKRRKAIESQLDISLPSVAGVLFDENEVYCENLIGGTILPMGVAGPLLINGECTKGECFVPLATTEGALVASVNRGCKAITVSGGVNTYVETVGATRGPVFLVSNLNEGRNFKEWIEKHFSQIKEVVRLTSSYINLLKIESKSVGRYVFLRLYFDTAEAMGMNMVTIATDSIVKYIQSKRGTKCICLSGNYCIDKKPAWLNFISGRGKTGWAETVIKKSTVGNILKTTPEKLYKVWLSKCLLGSLMAGSLGYNAHYANIIAAFFAATGQDLAHVVEGSMGVTFLEILEKGDLYISVYLPALMVGTVGGGTNLQIKKEAISIMKVNRAEALTEILVGVVLAGELSLLSSLEEGSLAKVHKKLGR